MLISIMPSFWLVGELKMESIIGSFETVGELNGVMLAMEWWNDITIRWVSTISFIMLPFEFELLYLSIKIVKDSVIYKIKFTCLHYFFLLYFTIFILFI